MRGRGRDHLASASDRPEAAVSWIALTLVSASILGMIGVLDKAFLYHYARSLRTLPLLIAISHVPIGIAFIAISPLEELTVAAASWSLAAGVLGGLSAVVFFKVMVKREVTRTIPVVQTYPIFVAPLAVLFLDESLRTFHWFAILVTVAGAVMMSMRQDAGGRGFVLDRSFYELLGASLLLAGMNLAAKQAVETLPVLLVHGLRSFGSRSSADGVRRPARAARRGPQDDSREEPGAWTLRPQRVRDCQHWDDPEPVGHVARPGIVGFSAHGQLIALSPGIQHPAWACVSEGCSANRWDDGR